MNTRELHRLNSDASHPANQPIAILLLVLLLICSFVTGYYLKSLSNFVFQAALLAIAALSFFFLRNQKCERKETIAWLVFSFVFSLAIVAGFHVVIEGSTYAGTVEQNRIAAYGWGDILALAAMTYYWTTAFLALFEYLKHVKSSRTGFRVNNAPISWKLFALLLLLAFVLFIPYLLAYFPVLVFGDSMSSLVQIANDSYMNHHPFFYTMIIKACLKAASLFGFGWTAGCCLYSLLQMAVMAASFSYMACWIQTRCRLGRIWAVVLVIALCASPYIATYSVSMWKDPLFSCFLMLASIMLADFVLTRGNAAKKKSWLPLFTLFLILMCLLRSNGIYICLVLLIILCVSLIVIRKGIKQLAKVAASVFLSCAIVLLVTGPLYEGLGVQKPREPKP